MFLLLLVPLHGFAMPGGWSSSGHTFDLAHELQHMEGVQHHHDADGTIHYDDSGKSAQHHAEHGGCGHALALPSYFAPKVMLTAYPFVTGELPQFVPDRIPERPQRPPQFRG